MRLSFFWPDCQYKVQYHQVKQPVSGTGVPVWYMLYARQALLDYHDQACADFLAW